jgi:hypothetical protein
MGHFNILHHILVLKVLESCLIFSVFLKLENVFQFWCHHISIYAWILENKIWKCYFNIFFEHFSLNILFDKNLIYIIEDQGYGK